MLRPLCFLSFGFLAAPLAGQSVTGYVQPRFESVGDSALFKVRRARLGVQGDVAPWVRYKVQAELRSGGTGATPATVAATDLYLALARGPWTATLGQSKTPFSAELLHSSTTLELPERAIVVDSLAPSRDVGVQAEWNAGGVVALQAGVFNGEGINRAANADGRFLYVGRAVIQFMDSGGLVLGASAAGQPDTSKWGVDAAVARPRFAARAEYVRRHAATGDVTTAGWYAFGAYEVLARRFQLVGRIQAYDPDDAAGGDRVAGYTGGAQYFFAGEDLKLQVEYTAFDEEGATVSNNRVIVQMQARF